MAQGPKTGTCRVQVALQKDGGCPECLARLRLDVFRLFGPGLRTLTLISQCQCCKANSRGPTTPKAVALLGTWLSDRSYVCDGRCGNSGTTVCSSGTKSSLLHHFTSKSSQEQSDVTAPNVDETAFRHLLEGLCVPRDDLSKLLKETVQCIGCRNFVDTMYNEFCDQTLGFLQLSAHGDVRLAPVMLEPWTAWDSAGTTTTTSTATSSSSSSTTTTSSGSGGTSNSNSGHGNSGGMGSTTPRHRPAPYVAFVHRLLSVCESLLWDEITAISESRNQRNSRTKRCSRHTLESHRSVKWHGWADVWELLEDHERQQVCRMETGALNDTVNAYVQKHRFCGDCKSKVLRALMILTGELDPATEKGYVSPLYSGFTSKPEKKVVEISAKTEFITDLILRAMPEALAAGTPNEVHAKTFDTAQEQVLLCVGLQLLKDLHSFAMRCHLEYRGERLLLLTALMAITRQYQKALTAIGCASAIDNYEEEQKQIQLRKKEKRLRKKKRKQQQQQETPSPPSSAEATNSNCHDDEDDEDEEDEEEDEDAGVRCQFAAAAEVSSQSADGGKSTKPGVGACADCDAFHASTSSSRDIQRQQEQDRRPGGVQAEKDKLQPHARRKRKGRPSEQTRSRPAVQSLPPSGRMSHTMKLCSTTATTANNDTTTTTTTTTTTKLAVAQSLEAETVDMKLSYVGDDELIFLSNLGWSEVVGDESDTPAISQDVIDEYMANKQRHDERRRELRRHLRSRFDNLSCDCLKMRQQQGVVLCG